MSKYIRKTKPQPVPPPVPTSEPKPVLIRCGKHFINPSEVSSVKEAKDGLWIIKFKGEPNPEYPTWIRESELEELLPYFDVKTID